MTRKQKLLALKHGTPEQFEKAVMVACNNGTITNQEAMEGIDKYKREWEQAGARKGRGPRWRRYAELEFDQCAHRRAHVRQMLLGMEHVNPCLVMDLCDMIDALTAVQGGA